MGAFTLKIKNIQASESIIYIGNIIKAGETYEVQGDLERISIGFDANFIADVEAENKIEIYKDDVLMTDLNKIKNVFKQTADSISVDNSSGMISSTNAQDGIIEATLVLYKDNGIQIPDGPYRYLNFGNALTASKESSDTARVDLNPGDIWGGFGLKEVSDEDEESTTSTSWQTKVTMTLAGITEGKYRIGAYWEWQNKSPSNESVIQLVLDDTTELAYQYDEVSDASSFVWHPVTAFKYEDLSSGNHTIKINWKSSKKKKAAKIRRARIEIWRVGNVSV